jgi:hypothetical protein
MMNATTPDTQSGAAMFDPMHGEWRVHHRRLQRLFDGCAEWREFSGTSATRPVLGGRGNIEDNVIDDPLGAYRAIAIRSFDPATGDWRIWWLDERRQAIDPPVTGRLQDGSGEFIGADVMDGRDILVRFRWSGIGGASPRWEQAFSADGGVGWEINWVMAFSRA